MLRAPRKLVWEAWTDPKHLKEWWGPEQFTNPRVEGEVKLGGVMNITMRGPKGSPWDKDLPMIARYVEIVPGKKLVFENEPLGENGEKLLEGLTTVTFADHPEGTLMEMTTTAKALVEGAVAMLQGMDQGWQAASTSWSGIWRKRAAEGNCELQSASGKLDSAEKDPSPKIAFF